jgi:hypothetical protein
MEAKAASIRQGIADPTRARNPAGGEGVALFAVAWTWPPLLLLPAVQGLALGKDVRIPFLLGSSDIQSLAGLGNSYERRLSNCLETLLKLSLKMDY